MSSFTRCLTLTRPLTQVLVHRPIAGPRLPQYKSSFNSSPSSFSFSTNTSRPNDATSKIPSARAAPFFSTSSPSSTQTKPKTTMGMDDPNPSSASNGADSRGHEQARGTETTGLSEWKQRAPYRVHESNDEFKARYEANCHCGKVKYQISRKEPLDSKLCHCSTCQTQHAAPFQWAAIFHKEDINFVHGHHNLEWYDPSSKSIEHKLPCKVRCSYCHSPIMDEGRNMILLFPSLVHLKTDEEKALFKPRCHMFYGQRVMDIPDGLPKWTGLCDSSDLIEDSPPDLVREHERKREAGRKERFDKGENE